MNDLGLPSPFPPDHPAPSARSGPPDTPLRVLVVDDNQVNLRVAAFLLQRLGCLVDTARSGAEAVAKAAQDHRLILMDIQMEGMDGYASADLIRRHHPQARFRIGAYTNMPAREVTLNPAVGLDCYLGKPRTLEAMQRLIHDHL